MKDQETAERDHARFLEHLDASNPAVFQCAKFFYDKGIQVAITPMTKSKDYNDRLNHTDDGDLYIQQRIEVKGLSRDFTDGSDWPFDDFIVCAAHSYDRAKPKPYAYMILNRNRTHVAIVYGKSRPHWTTKFIKDSRYEDLTQEFYLIPIEHVDFRALWKKTKTDYSSFHSIRLTSW